MPDHFEFRECLDETFAPGATKHDGDLPIPAPSGRFHDAALAKLRVLHEHAGTKPRAGLVPRLGGRGLGPLSVQQLVGISARKREARRVEV